MYGVSDLKKDTLVQIDGVPYKIIDYQHTQLGRGGAIVKTKLKNLLNNTVLSKTFKGNEKVESAQVERLDMQYLYKQAERISLMDSTSYEQYGIDADTAGAAIKYLPEGSEVIALVFEGKVIGLELPKKLIVKVASTDAAVRGDTAKAAQKPARLETGASVQVPLFIKTGDSIRIDASGQYLERA